MSPEQQKALELLSLLASTNRALTDLAARVLASQPEEEPEHTRCDHRVYQFVRDAKTPPTKQEVVDALSEDGAGSPSTVEKSIMRLVKEGHIKSRPRPLCGYVVADPIAE